MAVNEFADARQNGPTTTADEPGTVTGPADGAEAAETAALRAEVEQLHEAMDSRAEIEQARGILMAVASCSSQAAWDLLVEISQHSNVKLRVVSAALVAVTTGKALSPEIEPAYRSALTRMRDAASRRPAGTVDGHHRGAPRPAPGPPGQIGDPHP